MMTFGKVSTPILHSSLHCSKFLSPQRLQFNWDLMKLMKTFQPLVLKKMKMKNSRTRLPLKRNQKFLSLKNLRLRFQRL